MLAASLVSGSVIPASADSYVFRYRQHAGDAAVSPPDPGDSDAEFGIGNDITVYFTGAIGYQFEKAIPVATADVVEWRRVSGSYQPGLALDADAGIISGVASGTTARRTVLLLGYDVGGKAIARANITFTFVNPVGAPQGLVFYGHTNQHMMQEIPASVPVARWEPLTPLPSEFGTRARQLSGTPLRTYNTGVAFVGYDYMNQEVAFSSGDLVVQDGPTINQISSQHRHPDKIFSASADVQHRVGKLQYRLIALDGKPSSLGFNSTTGVLKGTIPTFNTSLRFQIEAVDVDGTKGVSNVFTFSTYAPDVDVSKIKDMQGTAGTPFSVRLTGEDLSGERNWQVIAGQLPEGLSLDPETGEITGTPVREEIQDGIVISVSTSDNGYGETKPFKFTIHHEQVVVSFDPANVRTNESFTTAEPVLAKGVIAPYSFRVADGSTVDPALTADEAAATVSGILATAGSYDVQFNFTNGDGRETVFNQPIQAYNPLSLSYDSVITAYRRVPALAEPVIAENSVVGDPSFRIEAGVLPEGLYLNGKTGGIFGTAVAEGLTSGVSVRLADESGSSVVSNTFSVDVQDRPDIEVAVATTSIERYVDNTVKIVNAVNAFDSVTFELVSGTLPHGLTFNPDGFVEGSTTDAIGSYPGFQIRATDGEGYTSLSPVFSLEIVAPGGLGQLEESDVAANWTVNVPFSLPLPRPDNAYGPVSYVLNDLPEGVSVVGDRLVGAVGQVGSLAFPMTLTDDVGRSLSGIFTLNILEPMTATLSGSSAKVSAFSFMRMASAARFDLPRGSDTSITALIENGIEPISYSFTGSLPDGLSYEDGTISGVPVTENQSRNASLTVTDVAGTSVTLPATLATVRRLNIELSYDFSAPVFLNSGLSLPRKPVVKNSIGEVTYELTAGQLPPGMRIEAKTGYITGIPTQDGRFPGLIITAVDSEGAEFSGSYGPFEVGVSRLGTVGLASKTYPTVRAVREFLHMLNVTNVTHPLVFASTSADGIMPHGLALGRVDGSVSGSLAVGKYEAGIRVTDDFDRTRSTSMLITAVGPLSIAAPATKSFNQYASVSVKPIVTNPVGATRYELVAGKLPDGLDLDASTGAITGTPTVVGTSSGLVIRLTDGTGDAVQTPAFNIAVTNRLPLTIATVASYPVIANRGYRFTVPVTNAVGKVTFAQTGTLPPGIFFSAATGQFFGVATNIGSFPVTVTATDSVGGTATKTFTLAVTTNNQPINLSVTNFVTKVGHPISTKPPTYSNHVGDIRFWADDTLAQHGLRIDPATGVISGAATELLDFTPNIHITDGSDRVTSRPIRIQVIPGMVVSFPERLQKVVNGPNVYHYATRDNVVGAATWKYEGTLPKGMVFNISAGAFTGTPTEMGTFRGVITSTDSLGDIGSASVEIVIVNNGLPPTISFTSSSSGYVVTSFYTRLVPTYGNQKVGDVVELAPDSNPLPPGMTIVRETSGTHVISKAVGTSADVGVYRGIKLRITDVEGLYSDTGPMTFIYVSNPRLTYQSMTFSSRTNQPVSIARPLPSAGQPSADVTFAFSSRSLGGQTLTIDPETGAIGGYITASGSNVVTVTESYDGITIRSTSYTVSFTALELTVTMPDIAAYLGEPLANYTIKVTNPSTNPRMELVSGPSWLQFDPLSGSFSGIPDATGAFPFSVEYTDDHGSATLSGRVSVNSGDAGYKFLKILYTDTGQYKYGSVHTIWLNDENGADALRMARVVSQKQDWTLALDLSDETGADLDERSGRTNDLILEFPRKTVFSSARSIGRFGGYTGLGTLGETTTIAVYGSDDGVTFTYLGKGRGTFALAPQP